jgi:type III pantothenate kinase
MKLAIDIGNTSVSVGLFENYDLVKKIHFFSINEFISFLDSIKNYDIECAIISSVVPSLTTDYRDLLTETYQYQIFIINHKLTNLSLQVDQPETIGTDRLCNIFATKRDYSIPAIIVDFGTATTYDIINLNGDFIGGAIATGVETSAQYLIDKAALLSKTDLIFPNNVIGIDTTTNIQSGVMFGAVDQVHGMINRIKEETNTDYSIFLTGGFSKLIVPQLNISHTIDTDLTLKGMIYIYNLNH